MSRRIFLIAPLALLACDREPSRAPNKPQPTAAPFDNGTAEQSIVRPEVIAEVEPSPTPVPSMTPTSQPRETSVAFPSGTRLNEAGRNALDSLLAGSALPANARFILRGHSDAAGSDRENLRTSRRRAEAVQTYLIKQGVGADRIEVIALGERRPIAPSATLNGDDDPAGRARNRRVDVEVIPPATTQAASPAPSPSTEEKDGQEGK